MKLSPVAFFELSYRFIPRNIEKKFCFSLHRPENLKKVPKFEFLL